MEKKNFENLNAKYRKSCELANQSKNLLVEYLNESVSALGGEVKLTGFCKTYEEAEEAGIEFENQFPSEIGLADKHGCNHNIYITRLYKSGETFYIDGYDYTDGEWVKGWFVTELSSNYRDLACFIDAVINPSEPEETPEISETTRQDAILVGYQLVDEDDSFPTEFGCWDVFRTTEDAEAYRQNILDPEDYRVIEEWSYPIQADMYHFHTRVERHFVEGETVWVKDRYRNIFVPAKVRDNQSIIWDNDCVHLVDESTNTSFCADADRVYEKVNDTVCPDCGKPLYRGHWTAEEGESICVNCTHLS